MKKTYRGKYQVKNPQKYKGDFKNVVYRSSWELAAFVWLDKNPDILEWNSESVVVPYICPTDLKHHRYFIDLYFKTKANQSYLIEIKPSVQCKPPKTPKRKTKRFLNETLTYSKNQAKWNAATNYAIDRGMRFLVWDEHILKNMGVKILTK